MKILVLDNSAKSSGASMFERALRLIEDPEIEIRFSTRHEHAIDDARSFQPSVIVFTNMPRGARCERLIDALHALAPSAVILYLRNEHLFIHPSTFTEPGTRRHGSRKTMPSPSLHDFAAAVAVSAAGYA